MFKSIGTKLLVVSFAMAAIPVLLVSLIGYQANRKAIEEQIFGGLRALSNERARSIDHIIRLRQEETMEIAGASVVRQLRSEGGSDPLVIRNIQEHIDWTYLEIKLMSLNTGVNTGKSAVVESIQICDTDGAVVAASNKALVGQFLSAHYGNMAKKSGSYFGGITEDPKTHKVFLTFVEKIRGLESQEFAGYVVLKVSVDILNEITTAPAGLGKTEEAYIIDRDFFVMTRLKENKGSGPTLQQPGDAIVGCFANAEVSSGSAGEEPLSSPDKDKTDIYKNYAGTTVLGSTKYLPNQDWCLVHEIELEEAFEPVAALRRNIFIMFLICIVGVLGVAYLTSRTLSQPILSVRNAALSIANGNTDVRTGVSSQDEIGDLATAFNQMTDRLVQSQNELSRSNQDLEEFSYVASHDLQEPLRKIVSYGDILQEDHAQQLSQEGKECIQTMQKAASRMRQLIEALLEYSRVTRKERPLEPVSLEHLIGEVSSDLETAIRESGGAVKVGSLPTIKADPIQMRQLFQNLIGNALKFAKKDTPPLVMVQARVIDSPKPKDPKMAEIKVSDNGIGFESKFADKVFQPFQRLVTRDQYKGTGIGLSVCKKIVERHHGKISVASEPGKGTTFTILLPVA